MAIDFWAWRHWEDPKLRDELVVADGYEDDVEQMLAESMAKEATHAARIASVPESDWEDV